MTTIVLGSASPRRQSLFESVFKQFEIRSADAEPSPMKESPQDFVIRSAEHKVREIRSQNPSAVELIFGFDTVVSQQQSILEKPEDKAHARAMLEDLLGSTHLVHTGFAVLDPSGQILLRGAESTRVFMNPGNESDIQSWMESGQWSDKAGAYAIQHPLCAPFVERIEGCWYNVVGLPVARLCKELSNLGLRG